MLVGLLAKLIATLVLILLALGIFVGGEKFVSYLDRAGGPSPPTAERAAPDSVPHTAVEFAPTPPPSPAPRGRAAPSVAVMTDPTPTPARPTRGALRPSLDTPPHQPAPAPPPARREAATPPTAAVAAPALPPPANERPAPTPAERVDTAAPSPPPPPRREAAPRGVEPVLVDLQIGRLVSRTVVAYRDGETALVPLSAFFELAEIAYAPPRDGVFEARLEPSGQDIRIVAGADSLTIGRRRLPVAPGELLEQDGELFLATAPLGTMLDVEFQVSWPDLAVVVLNPDSLPVARRYWRDQMRAMLAERYGARPDTTLGLPRSKWDGMVLDYNLSFPLSDNLVGGASYQFSMGGQVAGGSLEIGVRSLGTIDYDRAEFAATWKGVWIDNTYVKQLTLGTTTLTGPRYAGVRGVAVTNSPYIRPTYVGQLNYYGRLEPGWQLEAYSGSQLVAFDSIGANGDYSISLPVGYGENPVDFVAYGPTGQIRRFNQTYRVVSEQLPYRQLEYGVAAGECVSALCEGAFNADLHYGLSRRVTVRGGVEGYSRDGLSSLVHPYGVVTGLVGNAITLEGEAIGNGWLRGAVRFEPSLDLRVAAGYSQFDTSVDQSVIAPAGRRSQWIFDGFLRPVPALASFYLQAAAELDEGVDVDMSRARLQASLQVDMVRLYPYVRFERFAPTFGEATSAQYLGLSAYANGRPSWGSALGALWFRGDLEAGGQEGGLSFAAATIARSFGPALRVEGGAAWRRGNPGTIFTLSLVSYLPTVQATTTAIAPTEGPGSVVQTLQGAVVYDNHQGRLTANPNAGIQRSGVSGTVFTDDNANGRQDPGEPGVGGVRVIVGSSSMTTDSAGRYYVWDIPAFEPVRVQIDSTSLENPLYVPAFGSASLQPPPNAYRNFDLPLVTGAVLEGRVVRDGAPLPGVTLVLTNTGNGKQTSIATFSDGSFYVLGVKPGQYTLAVDPRDLAARRLVGGTLRLTAQPGAPDQLSNLVVQVRSAN
ncbi:MAG TPA: carboxypeptidase-like regulatory domain-containing protein [Gemmatimonadales bacterium]|nr:carboxypeptidase-like regulatory domain-containing protein [Gemmatimonadales bacterium]